MKNEERRMKNEVNEEWRAKNEKWNSLQPLQLNSTPSTTSTSSTQVVF
jgi:hypothetical protein